MRKNPQTQPITKEYDKPLEDNTLHDELIELIEEFDIRTSEGVTSWMGDIDHPQQRKVGGGYPCWRAIAVHAEQTIAFYRIECKTQYNALLDYQFNEIQNASI